jgi:hypothetical protein
MYLNILLESANLDGVAITNTTENLLKTEAFINVRVPSIDVELRSDAPNLLVPVTSVPIEVSGVVAHTRTRQFADWRFIGGPTVCACALGHRALEYGTYASNGHYD